MSTAGVQPRGDEVEVPHLGTAPGEEGRGHARALLHALAAHLNVVGHVVAETDDTAVGFYRRAGFVITPIPSPWPGTRYRCALTRP